MYARIARAEFSQEMGRRDEAENRRDLQHVPTLLTLVEIVQIND
jgi:hypothetical protein